MRYLHSKVLTFLLLITFQSMGQPPTREYFELRIYHLKTDAQEKQIDQYLSTALLPALRRAGISKIGVFKPIELDTTARKVYVLIPHERLNNITETTEKVTQDKEHNIKGQAYLDAAYNNPPFTRLETVILTAFSHHPLMQLPDLKGTRAERVYELRSYEGHTEKIFSNKVHMFNEGGEVALFKRLGFNINSLSNA